MARSYVVRKGDTLAKIAKAQLGDAKLWQQIADLNGLRDPGRIAVGQRLEIPTRRELEPPPPPPPLPAAAAAPALLPPHGLPAVLAEFGDIYARLREDGTLDPRWETEQLARAVRSFGGCFNFRAKRSGSKLSTHAWGIAIDLNPETNAMGGRGDMDLGIVAAFKSAGFVWGGDWAGKNKDPMHFQFCSGY